MSTKIYLCIIAAVVPISFALVGLFIRNNSSKKTFISVIEEGRLNTESNFYLSELTFQIRKKLIQTPGEFGFAIKDLKTGETILFNEDTNFPAASLYKLILIAAVYKEIEEGRLSLSTPVGATLERLKAVYGGLDFGYDLWEGDSVGYTVQEALTRVATVSDNFAAIILTDKIRQTYRTSSQTSQMSWFAKKPTTEPLLAMAKSLNLDDTTFDPPQTTVSNMLTFFDMLYKGQVVSQSASNAIIELLSTSRLNNRIPSKLPKELYVASNGAVLTQIKENTTKQRLKIAHKTGELSRVRHDVGIVYLPNNPYTIILLSKDLGSEEQGIEVFAEISKIIFDYFLDKK